MNKFLTEKCVKFTQVIKIFRVATYFGKKVTNEII